LSNNPSAGHSAYLASRCCAGDFYGDVFIHGNSTATGTKSAIVPHPDGSHRALYCVESPECWFEDFGAARLVDGTVTVHLDPDFAAVVHSDAYHVFLTPAGDSNGLYVSSKIALA